MYCVWVIRVFREFEPAISVPQNQPRRNSQRHFSRLGSGNHSAIHVKVRPGYVRGLRTGDKRDQRGDLINVPIATERCGHVDEVAALVAFVAGPESSYITGANLNVDGGMIA